MSQGLCTSCGAAVNLAAGQEEINCTYCGTLVTRPQAEAQFAEVKNSKFGGTLLIAETAQEGGSYEEALNYYNKVIEQQPDFADAWLNKGICTVRTSKIGDVKIPEAISSWKAAIKFAKNPVAMKKRVATEINNVVSDFYPVLENHYLRFHNVEDSLSEHGGRFLILESALSMALELSPTAAIAKNGISLCDRFVASIKNAASSDANTAAAQLFHKDWKGALSSAATASSKGNVASDLEKTLRVTKDKYEQALAKIDPTFAKQITIRDAKQAGISAKEAGSAFAGLALLFLIGALIWAAYDYFNKNDNGERLFGVADVVWLLVAIGTFTFAMVRYTKKQNERNKDWLSGLPACFGTADLKLAMHPTEEEHFHKLLESSLKAGFDYSDIRNEIEKYLKERGCTEDHLEEQLRRFDVLAKFQPDMATQLRRKNEARKAARENKKDTQPTALSAAESQNPAKVEPSKFRSSNSLVNILGILGIWFFRIVGSLGCLAAIGMGIDSINGKAKSDGPGIGGSVFVFLLFAGMLVYGFWPRKNKKEKPQTK